MIHNLPDGWEVKTLGDVVETIISPKKIQKNDYKKIGNFPIIDQSQKDIAGWTNDTQTLVNENKPLVIFGDHTCNIKYTEKPFAQGADGIKILKTKKNLLPKFLYFSLKNISIEIDGYKRHFTKLKKYSIPIPPLTQQKSIVKKLDACFKQISQAKTNLEQNLQNTKDLFKSTLNQILQNSNDDWEVKTLGEVCEVLDKLRKPITKRDRIEGEYPYYGATGILSYVHKYIFDEKLVLIGEDGAKWLSGDNTSFIVEGKYWVNNHAHVIRPNRNKVLDEWIVYFLNFSNLSKYITGLTVPKLNQEKMNSIKILIPPLTEQKSIVKKLDALSKQTKTLKQNYQNQLKHLEELKKSLLEKAFTGELT